MKIVFAFAKAFTFTYFEQVVRELCADGHEVIILHGYYPKEGSTDRALRACQKDTNCKVGPLLMRKNWTSIIYNTRELANFATYYKPGFPTNQYLTERYLGNFSLFPRLIVKQKFSRTILQKRIVRQTLLHAENLIPPEESIVNWLKEQSPDVVIASPYIYPHSREIEYIKAAKSLGIPSVAAVFSWDNMTTKGTFLVMPDSTLVWNDPLVDEASDLHSVERKSLIVTGAPKFDPWFSLKPSLSRNDFCRQIGVDSSHPFITYLCSSGSISSNETDFVKGFAKSLHENPNTTNIQIVVRPYPSNANIWESFSAPNVVIWPKGGETPDISISRINYFNTLFHSIAAVGVNTSAFLEAAIVDRPCISIITEQHRRSQSDIPHFQHLLNGNFLEIAYTFIETTQIIAKINRGEDDKAENRRNFVKYFIRPGGLDISASHIMASAIISIGLKHHQPNDLFTSL
jgi:hypothetical protein